MDLSFFLCFVYKQVRYIVHIQYIKVIFHSQPDALEHLFTFRAAYSDGHCTSVTTFGSNERFFQDVFVGPKALATVDEQFRLGADGHKKDGRGEDEPVCFEHFFCDYLIIIIDSAFSCFVAGVALCAGCDIEVSESDVFGLCAGGFSAG